MGCSVSGMGVKNRLTKIKFKTAVHLQKLYTPLTRQVEELELAEKICNLQVATTQHPKDR